MSCANLFRFVGGSFVADIEKLLSVEKAAAAFKLSVSQLHKLTATGEVSSVRLGMRRWYVKDELERELFDRGRRDRRVTA